MSFVMVYSSSSNFFGLSYVSLMMSTGYLAALIIFSLVCLKNACCGQEKMWYILFNNIEEFDSTMEGQTIILEKDLLKY